MKEQQLTRRRSRTDGRTQKEKDGKRQTRKKNRGRREGYSQRFVVEIGRLRWVQLVQLAVENVEAEETHLWLGDRRELPRLRINVPYGGAVARRQARHRAATQPLLLRAAAASSHVPLGQVTSGYRRLSPPSGTSSMRFLVAAYPTSTSSSTRAGSRPRSARCRADGGVNSCFITRHL